MTARAYYNEIDPVAAQWLRNLIAHGHIAPGDVDERSIEDVRPAELMGYTQCHFFAGVGVWSYALRQAGWPDDRRVWTGSCPCQPFSAAGEGAAFADERHLWPAFFHLIAHCNPAEVYGEQVASKDAEPWIDLVCNDLGSLGYACGAIAFPSAGVGAPHIRDRLYWGGALGDTERKRLEGHGQGLGAALGRDGAIRPAAATGESGGMADADSGAAWRTRIAISEEGSRSAHGHHTDGRGVSCRLGNAERHGRGVDRPGPVNGFWRAADWLACRDERWRPVEPGTFPLAHGAAARVGRLRAYGNAINAEAARIFIECFNEAMMDCEADRRFKAAVGTLSLEM